MSRRPSPHDRQEPSFGAPPPQRPQPARATPPERAAAPPPPPQQAPSQAPAPGPKPRRKRAPDPQRPRRSWLGRLIRWGLMLAVWGVIAVGGIIAYYWLQLPPFEQLADTTRRPAMAVTAADGTLLSQSGDVYGDAYSVADLPPWLPQAVVSVEDRRFYSHWGVDPIGLMRAVWTNQRAGHLVQGGSTLTQQVAKNVFLSSERSLKRKVQEALIAIQLERRFTKDQILTIYLNRVYLGAGVYGVDAAAKRYFGKPATQVSLHEAAVLAGLLKAPSKLSPARDPAAAAARAQIVLSTMVRDGAITQEQAAAAAREAPQLVAAAEKRVGRHFSDWVLDQAADLVPLDRDLVIVTTLDPRLQKSLEDLAAAFVAAEGEKRKFKEIAALVLDAEGGVRAMIGGRDYGASQFNRAVNALRQPGSSFKPIVAMAALEEGVTPDQVFDDAPVRYGSWTPGNYDGKYRGPVTLTEATAHSLNTVYARLAKELGPKRIISQARRMGISTPIANDLTIALGSSAATLIEMTGAYTAIAFDGMARIPHGIQEIRERDGKVLWRPELEPIPSAKPEAAIALRGMLSEVVRAGTGKNAEPGLATPAWGKSGTTQDFHDAWFIGGVGDMVAGVWVGNDDGSHMQRVTGGDVPARFWRSLARAAAAQTP